jgi:hypothetical protein
MAVYLPIVTQFNNKGLKQAQKGFKDLEGAQAKAKYALGKANKFAAAGLGALAAGAVSAVKAASDMAEAQSKVNVIFGEGSKEIAAFAKTASDKIGQSKQAVFDAAGTFGTFGKAAGLSGTNLAKFATGFSGLASDLASFNNSTPEEAIAAIGSGLRGEAEPLRRFGILLNDATLKAAALELKIYDGSGALTDQQKILAAQKVIFEQSTDAQGDFARTSDGLANSQRTLSAKLADTQAAIGQGFLPVVEAVLPLLKTFADWAADNPDKIKIVAGAFAVLAASVVLVNAAMALNPAVLITAGIVALGVALVMAYKKFDTFRAVVNAVVNQVARNFEFMANAFITMINVVIKGINLIKPGKDIGSLGQISLGRLGGNGSAAAGGANPAGLDYKAMATGGIVTSPTMALIGEAGPEAVIPLNKAGGLGMNITVNAGLVSTPDQIGTDIIAAIQKAQRRSGTVFAPA